MDIWSETDTHFLDKNNTLKFITPLRSFEDFCTKSEPINNQIQPNEIVLLHTFAQKYNGFANKY